MSQRFRKASLTLLFTGAGLSLLSATLLISMLIPREMGVPHPMHDAADWGKPKVTRDDPAHALMLLEAIDQADADLVAKATMLVAAGMAHYWPERGVHDAALDCGFLEDPVEWTRLRFVAGVEEFVPGSTVHRTLERADWRIALSKGVGFCSQQAMVLAAFLRERGIDTDVQGLNGHVVAVAHAQGGDMVLDPDYGVVLRFSLAQAESDPERVRAAYLAAGYGAEQTDMVVKIYGAEGNALYRTAHTKHAAPRAAVVLLVCIVMMLVGIYGLRQGRA